MAPAPRLPAARSACRKDSKRSQHRATRPYRSPNLPYSRCAPTNAARAPPAGGAAPARQLLAARRVPPTVLSELLK